MTFPRTPPIMPVLDTSALVPPQITWFDGATGELTGTYSQVLDRAATQAAYQSAWQAAVVAWQAACTALDAANAAATPPITTVPNYPAPPAAPAVAPVWLTDPYHMTAIAPPALQAGMRPVFANGAWTQVEDHRGVPLWDATGVPLPHLIGLGPLPVGALTVQPPPSVAQVAAALAAAKSSALAGVIGYANKLSSQLTQKYPPPEQASWPGQAAEARAWMAGQAASPPVAVPAPFLSQIVAAKLAKGQPTPAQISAVTPAQITALAGVILASEAAYYGFVATLIGMRSDAQAEIAAAPDLAALATALTAVEAKAAAQAIALGMTP